MGQKKLLTWIKASETPPTETIIKVPIKILWENGFTYSLGSYNADDDDWWELPNNAIIPDEQIEYLSESLSSSPSIGMEQIGEPERVSSFMEWIDEKNYIRDEDAWYEEPQYKHEGELGLCVASSTANLYRLYLQFLPAPKPAEQEPDEDCPRCPFCNELIDPFLHEKCKCGATVHMDENSPIPASTSSKGDEMPEGPWRLKGHSYAIGDTGDYYGYWELSNGKIAIFTKDDPEDGELEKIIKALNASECDFYMDESMSFLYHHEKQERESLQQQLSSCQAARDEAMNDANVYKELYAKAQKDIAALKEQLGKVMEERDDYRSGLSEIAGGKVLPAIIAKMKLEKYPKQ